MSRYLVPEERMNRADNLFVAATAYHVILAHILANVAGSGTSVLLMKRQLQIGFRTLFESVQADKNTPFSAVYLLDRPAVRYKQRWRAVIDRTRLSSLRQLVETVKPSRLFLFNDDVLDQYLARRVKSSGGSVHAVEDGAVAYTDQIAASTLFERVQRKLLFGPATYSAKVEGCSSNIDTYFARHPDVLRPELRSQPVVALPPASLELFRCLTWPGDFLRRLDVDEKKLDCEALMLLAHSRNFTNDIHYRGRLREIITVLLQEHGSLAVSYHPRERSADWLGLVSLGVSLIPQAVPAEIIYLLNRGKLQAVYGDVGTSLMTASWFLPQVDAISLMDHLEISRPSMRRIFRTLNIKIR